jgi:hypothetical protein
MSPSRLRRPAMPGTTDARSSPGLGAPIRWKPLGGSRVDCRRGDRRHEMLRTRWARSLIDSGGLHDANHRSSALPLAWDPLLLPDAGPPHSQDPAHPLPREPHCPRHLGNRRQAPAVGGRLDHESEGAHLRIGKIDLNWDRLRGPQLRPMTWLQWRWATSLPAHLRPRSTPHAAPWQHGWRYPGTPIRDPLL